jgi:hypothetical protein
VTALGHFLEVEAVSEASYFEFAAFSRLAIHCADRRKTFETAAERSSLSEDL